MRVYVYKYICVSVRNNNKRVRCIANGNNSHTHTHTHAHSIFCNTKPELEMSWGVGWLCQCVPTTCCYAFLRACKTN